MNAQEFWAFWSKLTHSTFWLLSILPREWNQTVKSQWNYQGEEKMKQHCSQSNPNDPFAFRPKFDYYLAKSDWKRECLEWNGKYRSNQTDRSKKTNSGGDHFDRKIPRWTEISDNLGIMESSLCLDTNYHCGEGDRFFSVLDKILREKWENNWSCFLTRYFPLQFCYNR